MQKISAADHPLKSVTIFKSSKAEVNRTFSLKLKAGQNKIQISGLSSVIDTESVRISGLNEARLFDVVCTVENQTGDSPSEVMRLLNSKKNSLESQKRVLEHQADLLVSYAKTLTGEHVSPNAMGEFLQNFTARGNENLDAVLEIDEKIVEIKRQIAQETAKTALKTGEAKGQVTVVVVAAADMNVDLKLAYIVHGAVWHPNYELHATTENGKPSNAVSLHYRARITQSTGEDWANTALTLSTVNFDLVARSVPRLNTARIRQSVAGYPRNNNIFGVPPATNNSKPPLAFPGLFGNPTFGQTGGFMGIQQQQQPLQQQQQQQQAPLPPLPPLPGLFGSVSSSAFGAPKPSSSGVSQGFGAFGGAGLFGGGGNVSETATVGSATEPAPAESEEESFEEINGPGSTEPTTIVTESPLSISYAVEGQSTIPSDGVAHQVPVATLSFDSKVTYVCCPKIDARVFLQCEVKNTSEFRLLPGPVSVFLDDSYVSRTSIHDVNPADTFDCTLGADPSTFISYIRTFKTARNDAGAFGEPHNTTTYTNVTSIHNKHRFPLSALIVRDIIPLTDDKRIKVHLRKPDGLADAKEGEIVDLKETTPGLKVRWSPSSDGKGGEKEGRFEFLLNIEAGAKAKVESGWEVKAPADVKWHETAGGFV